MSAGLIYVIGGIGSGGNDYSDVWTYNINTLTWSAITTSGSTFTTRDSHSSVIDSTKNIIYVYGGSLGTGNAASDLWSFTTTTGIPLYYCDYGIAI